jgi:soluble lytic murein transglycosylase-like protein
MNTFFICLTAISMNLHNAEVICEYSETIIQSAEKYNLDPSLILAVGRVESRWTPKAESYGNACGVMQVLPKYTKNPKRSCEDLKDPVMGIEVGAKKLNYWIYKYGKKNKLIGLCGYNAGFRCKGDNGNKTGLKYAKSVLKWKRKISKAMRSQKRKYEKKNVFDYLFTLVGIIGDYK